MNPSPINIQKKLQWYSIFGIIKIEQQILRLPGKGPRIHPFRDFAKVTHRGCSSILSRRISDFSVERSFSQTEKALQEHYRIEVPRYSIDKVTDQVCRKAKAHNSSKPGTVSAAPVLISQVDGSMLPIIDTEPPKDASNQDRRKHRKCHWKEIRVSTVSNPDLADTYYGVALGAPFVIGLMMLECCQFKGMTPETHVHAVSDGASWIADQYKLHFGTQCNFLLDLFHACDYLSAAAQSPKMTEGERKHWIEQAKELLKKRRRKRSDQSPEKSQRKLARRRRKSGQYRNQVSSETGRKRAAKLCPSHCRGTPDWIRRS